MLETILIPKSWLVFNNVMWTLMLAIWVKDDYFNTFLKVSFALIATTGWALLI